jgi:hypothetical protein
MKLNIKLNLTQNSPQFIKGEELDEQLTSQLEDLQLDGWEVSKVTLLRNKSDDMDAERREMIVKIFEALSREVPDWSAPSTINPTQPKSELIEHWSEQVKRFVTKL